MKDVTSISIAIGVSRVCLILTGLFIPNYLGPLKYGILSTLLLILAYSPYLELGLVNGLSREIPYLRGKKQTALTKEYANTTFSFFIGITILAAIGIIGYATYVRRHYVTELVVGAWLYAIIMIIISLLNLYYTILRSENEFSLMSKSQILQSIAYTILALSLVFFIDIYGVFIATLLSNLITFLYVRMRYNAHLRWGFSWQPFKRLLKIGIPMTISAILFVTLTTIDRVVILKFFTTKSLGLYALGRNLGNYILIIPATIATVFAPRIYEEAGYDKGQQNFFRYLEKPNIIIAGIVAILCGIFYVSLPFGMKLVYPKFIEGLNVAKILVWSTFFISITQISNYIYVAREKQLRSIVIQVIAILITLAVAYLLIKRGYDIEGVAIASLASYIMYAAIHFTYSLYICKIQAKKVIRLFFTLFGIGVYTMIIGYETARFFPIEIAQNIMTIGIITFKRLVFLGLGIIPLLIFLNRKTEAITHLYTKFKLKLRK